MSKRRQKKSSRKNYSKNKGRTERPTRGPRNAGPKHAKAQPTLEGLLQIRRDGYGFVLSEKPEVPDVFIPARHIGPAWDGDRVVAEVRKSPRDGRLEGRVLKVLRRGKEYLVGELKRIQNRLIAQVAMNERVIEFVVPPQKLGGAKAGQSVGVRVLEYPEGPEPGTGEVIRIFPERGEEKTEIEVIIVSRQLPNEFSAPCLAEARAFQAARDIRPEQNRTDHRDLPFVTIDGETAKDFDDAILVRRDPRGFRLWVAIADVSHYVRPGSALDQEAWRRGTSVYFPGRCIPMLPEELSNDLCSLRPLEDRLAFTCELLLSPEGRPLETRVYKSLIRSRGRLTYNQVGRAVLHRDSEERARLGSEVTGMLDEAMEFSRVLRRVRFERGSIDFDVPEAEIIFNLEEGDIDKIVKAQRHEAHFLIEEFMIAANEAVARFIAERGWPALYRVHGEPDPEKVENFKVLLHNLGFSIFFPKRPTPKFFNQVLQQVKGHAEAALIQHILLRSMKQAVYSQENLGHFGLASTCYTHFTSPIRRYPDLVVHRVLAEILSGKKRPAAQALDARVDELAKLGSHTSTRERAAMEAEWEAVDLEVALFMKKFLGQTFSGVVARVAKFGFFVELKDFFVQGLVLLEDIPGDFYAFDEKHHRLRGRKSGRVFKIGTELSVTVAKVDILERRVLFSLTP